MLFGRQLTWRKTFSQLKLFKHDPYEICRISRVPLPGLSAEDFNEYFNLEGDSKIVEVFEFPKIDPKTGSKIATKNSIYHIRFETAQKGMQFFLEAKSGKSNPQIKNQRITVDSFKDSETLKKNKLFEKRRAQRMTGYRWSGNTEHHITGTI